MLQSHRKEKKITESRVRFDPNCSILFSADQRLNQYSVSPTPEDELARLQHHPLLQLEHQCHPVPPRPS